MHEQWSTGPSPGISSRLALERMEPVSAPLIAIPDAGIDQAHEGFGTGKFVEGYDMLSGKSGRISRPANHHGTSCAGIIGMCVNGSCRWEGVAPMARMLSVTIGKEIKGRYRMEAEHLAHGILKAVELGADILCLCWGRKDRPEMIAKAIERAAKEGRNGKGCIICCAAGGQGRVVFPATHPDVLCVGACNHFSEYKSYRSRDGDSSWCSAAGMQVDLVAPGTRICTLENRNSYTRRFGGTSGATAHVAGVAALVLAVNPALEAHAVYGILKSTCDPVAPHESAGHSVYTGYGRINALKAVQQARDMQDTHRVVQIMEWSVNEAAQRKKQ